MFVDSSYSDAKAAGGDSGVVFLSVYRISANNLTAAVAGDVGTIIKRSP